MPLFSCIYASICCFLRRGEEGRVKGYCHVPLSLIWNWIMYNHFFPCRIIFVETFRFENEKSTITRLEWRFLRVFSTGQIDIPETFIVLLIYLNSQHCYLNWRNLNLLPIEDKILTFDNLFPPLRHSRWNMLTAITFTGQNYAALRASNSLFWEKLALLVVLVPESIKKAPV